jgi:hypothetical protein
VIALAGAALCLWSASRVDLADIDDFGLVSALPWQYWAGMAALHTGFVVTLCTRRPPRWLYAMQISLLVLAIYGAAPVADAIPRGEVAWRHLGVMDNLVTTGHPDPRIDAYFNWPGFFALFAALTKASGLPLLSIVRWAPVWNNLLWLGAIGLTLRQITPDRRLVWLGMWLFASVNWIDQDYFAPQAFGFLLYVVIIGVALRWLRAEPVLPLLTMRRAVSAGPGGLRHAVRGWWASRIPEYATITTRQRAAALCVVIVLSIALTSSHQLTPFAAIAATAALVVTGRCITPRLPLAITVVVVGWMVYFASAYLAGHPVAPADVSTTAAANLTNRLQGSPEHMVVLRLRIGLTAAVWLLAAIGAVRRLRAGHHDVIAPALALACAPFLLIPVQSYGGEMLLRVALFSLPFAALLAASALLPTERSAPIRLVSRPLIAVVCVLLAAASVVSRYGNARFDMFRPGEVTAVAMVYRVAHPGDALISGAHPTPWRYRDYAAYRHTNLQTLCPTGTGVTGCYKAVLAAARRSPSGGGLVLITRTNRESLRIQGMMSPAELGQLERGLERTPGVTVLLNTADAQLYDVRHDRSRGGR